MNKYLAMISAIADRLGDEADYETTLQPMLCELSEQFDPNPFDSARRAIDTLQNFCETYDIRGVNLYFDNLYTEVLWLEENS